MVERGSGKAYVVKCNFFFNSLDFGETEMGMEMAVDKTRQDKTDKDMDMDAAGENENRMGCDCQRR